MISHPLTPESRINRIVIGSIIALMLLLGIGLGFTMMNQPPLSPKWRIGITNWPGYDPLYIADLKGFFGQQNLDIELIPINSLADMRTAFERGTIDGYVGTVMEAVESFKDTGTPNHIVLVTDYSSGADQLLSAPSITTIQDLKGARVGLESTSPISRYMFARALSGTNLGMDDFDIRSYNQSILVDQTIRHNLDALVTYEPYTTEIRAKRPMHILFSSAQLPEEILDAVMVSPRMLEGEPNLSQRLQSVWQSGLDYINAHPDETHAILAARYRVDEAAYRQMLTQVHFLDRAEIQRLASSGAIHQTLNETSHILYPHSPLTARQVSGTVNVWFQKEARR
ncbi:MAG: hypothetical protein EON60_09070 [Alphaproteobacteria bacterium]|nr:MAG: hypothetical protein EON60_09070 [Alphaproteobacteria bacterium]